MASDEEQHARHAAWRVKVQAYIDAGDRGEEPHFVGRKDLFDRVDAMLRSALAGQADSRTIAIGGAPGAGKSAFLRELAMRQRADGNVVVPLRPGAMNPVRLFEEIARTVGQRMQEREERTRRYSGQLGPNVAKATMSQATTVVTPADRDRLRDSAEVPWSLLKERFGDYLGPDKPLIVLCDEAQNLRPGPVVDVFLDSLNSGDPDDATPVPVVPVFAGLADTADALNRCGVTRPTGDNDLPISALSTAESTEYALKTLGHLDALGSQAERARWADWFANNCDRWPHHLRGQMTAVAKGMLRADTPALRDQDGTEIARLASMDRNNYYGRRLNATGYLRHRPLFASLALAADGAGADWDTLATDVDGYAERKGVALDADAVIRSAIHSGVLQSASAAHPDRLVCPIPSLRRWLAGTEHVVPPPPIRERGLSR